LLDVHGRHGCFCSVSVSVAGRRGGLLAGFILIDGWEVLVGTFLSKALAFLGNGACVRTSQIDWFVRVNLLPGCFVLASFLPYIPP
jgi:hypothetical protein